MAATILASVGAIALAQLLVWIAENLPCGLRSSGIAIIYGVIVTLFGGTTQLVLAWSIHPLGGDRAGLASGGGDRAWAGCGRDDAGCTPWCAGQGLVRSSRYGFGMRRGDGPSGKGVIDGG